MKHLGLFAAGVLFGTAGLKILSSKEAHHRSRSARQGLRHAGRDDRA